LHTTIHAQRQIIQGTSHVIQPHGNARELKWEKSKMMEYHHG